MASQCSRRCHDSARDVQPFAVCIAAQFDMEGSKIEAHAIPLSSMNRYGEAAMHESASFGPLLGAAATFADLVQALFAVGISLLRGCRRGDLRARLHASGKSCKA